MGNLFIALSCYVSLHSCCDGRYDFHIKMIFVSSLPPVVCWRVHVLLTLFVFACV